jgi:presenilin-like A22 family membrane protease
MLLWALNPENPYSYYILLRWVCCAAFAYLAFQALAQEKKGFVWVLVVTALVYNPVIRVHLTREIWSVINVATIAMAVASVFVLKAESGNSPPLNKMGDGAA